MMTIGFVKQWFDAMIWTMPSSTVENYLKQIYLEQQNVDMVLTGKLATIMGVVPGTATSMIKALAESGLVTYEPRGGTRLTPAGEHLALAVLRRHRLVELFLVKVLGLDWSEVHDEAEELEHAISDKVLDRIDQLLGHPSVDPHGDPIPTKKGDVAAASPVSLVDCPIDQPLRVSRILDQAPQFLQLLERSGLVPGSPVTVESRDPYADAVRLRVASGPVTLGTGAAGKILVES
jgi:DtxR family Mn-dependent transcriptional regulator